MIKFYIVAAHSPWSLSTHRFFLFIWFYAELKEYFTYTPTTSITLGSPWSSWPSYWHAERLPAWFGSGLTPTTMVRDFWFVALHGNAYELKHTGPFFLIRTTVISHGLSVSTFYSFKDRWSPNLPFWIRHCCQGPVANRRHWTKLRCNPIGRQLSCLPELLYRLADLCLSITSHSLMWAVWGRDVSRVRYRNPPHWVRYFSRVPTIQCNCPHR